MQIEPFLREKNGQFEGYIPDLIEKLSKTADFKYEIKLAEDNKYGQQLDDGSYDGMIGELIDGVCIIRAVRQSER